MCAHGTLLCKGGCSSTDTAFQQRIWLLAGLWTSLTTCRGRSLPTQAQPPQQGRSTQAPCCARLMAAGLRPLQKPASILLLGRHASACFCLKGYIVEAKWWMQHGHASMYAGIVCCSARHGRSGDQSADVFSLISNPSHAAGWRASSHGSCSEWTTVAAPGCHWGCLRRMLRPIQLGSPWS